MPRENDYVPSEYWDRRLSKDFSLAGVGYIGLGREYNKWLYRSQLATVKRSLKANNINCFGKRVLEIGPGTGFYIDHWLSQGIGEVVGIDIAQKSVQELVKKYPAGKFIRADISSIDTRSLGTFDIITAFDVLFHIVDEEKFRRAMENIKKLSHPGTFIFITDCFLKKPSTSLVTHVNLRMREAYRRALEDNGMRILEINPVLYLMMDPVDKGTENKVMFFAHNLFWQLLVRVISVFYGMGGFGGRINDSIGCILYHVDRVILKVVKNNPNSKLLVAVKE